MANMSTFPEKRDGQFAVDLTQVESHHESTRPDINYMSTKDEFQFVSSSAGRSNENNH